MSRRKFDNMLATTYLDKFMRRWIYILFACSILLVLVSTLYPFNFSFEDGFSVREIVSSFHHPSNPIDAIGNVLLFLPFGFSFTYLLPIKKLKRITALIVVLITSFSLSLVVEVLQVYLPSRDPTLFDLLTNSAGGCLGYLCFHLRSTIFSQILVLAEKVRKSLSLKHLTAGFIGWTMIACLGAIALQNSTHLGSWDATFPLMLGNEQTGNRPWRGYINDVYIANRAISKAEVERAFAAQNPFTFIGESLVASYQLIGKGDYRDQTGHLPDLSWRGKLWNTQDKKGVLLTANNWLETKSSASYITQQIRKTSQFTLSAIVATNNTKQTGPARIVSLSSDQFSRNFTLGQDRTDLVFRLRTPITGANGSNPELIVPNVFADRNFHHIIITYNGATLQFYIDQLQHLYSFKLSSEVTLFLDLLPHGSSRIRINAFSIILYTIFSYGLIFIPLGCMLALITTIVRGKIIFHILLICSGMLLPSLLLESILASGSERIIRLEYLLLSICITVSTMLIVRSWAVPWSKGNVFS